LNLLAEIFALFGSFNYILFPSTIISPGLPFILILTKVVEQSTTRFDEVVPILNTLSPNKFCILESCDAEKSAPDIIIYPFRLLASPPLPNALNLSKSLYDNVVEPVPQRI